MGIPDRPSGQTPIRSEEEGKQDRAQSGDTCVVMSICCRMFRIPGLDPGLMAVRWLVPVGDRLAATFCPLRTLVSISLASPRLDRGVQEPRGMPSHIALGAAVKPRQGKMGRSEYAFLMAQPLARPHGQQLPNPH